MTEQMDFVHESRARFGIVGPPVSEDEINAAFPGSFPGKDDLVRFYLQNNGGSRTPAFGVIHCGAIEHRATRNHLEKVQVEGFFIVQRDPAQRLLPFRSQSMYRATQTRAFRKFPAITQFLEQHRPLAFDHCGNDFWINLQDGRIQYMFWDSWQEGPIDFAPSFREFVTEHWNDAALLYEEHQFAGGIQQFEKATGLKYDTEEAIQAMAKRNQARED